MEREYQMECGGTTVLHPALKITKPLLRCVYITCTYKPLLIVFLLPFDSIYFYVIKLLLSLYFYTLNQLVSVLTDAVKVCFLPFCCIYISYLNFVSLLPFSIFTFTTENLLLLNPLLNKEFSLDKLLQQFFILLVKKCLISYNQMQKSFKLSQLTVVIILQTVVLIFTHPSKDEPTENINSSAGQKNGLLLLEQVSGHPCDANINNSIPV